MNKTAAVVVTYNRKVLLEQCIAHLQLQTSPVDIIVVDNASTDGTAEMFACTPENLHYFNTGANTGGAGGFNFGMRKAVEMGYEFVWVMDDDTLPYADAHKKLLEADAGLNGEYGWLSSLALWTDGTPCVMNVQKISKWKRLEDYEDEAKIQYASFVSLFLKADTIIKYGLPYKEFFIWGDDWEYTRRISKNTDCYFVPESTVLHKCTTNYGSDIVMLPVEKLDRAAYSYRNDVVVYRQDGFGGFVYMLLRVAKHTVKIILKSDNKIKKLSVMFKAIKAGTKFRPEIEKVQVE